MDGWMVRGGGGRRGGRGVMNKLYEETNTEPRGRQIGVCIFWGVGALIKQDRYVSMV